MSSSESIHRVLISGATGLVGSALCRYFSSHGVDVTKLSRRASMNDKSIVWDPASEAMPDAAAFEGFDAVVHLAGEPVFGRWSATKKTAIRESRVKGTQRLSEVLSQCRNRPKVLISAS